MEEEIHQEIKELFGEEASNRFEEDLENGVDFETAWKNLIKSNRSK